MLSKIYTPKQIEILKACRNTDWFMLINHGAKRSGKTQLDNDLFLAELRKVRQTADQLGITFSDEVADSAVFVEDAR